MKKVAERLSALGILAFAVGALAFLSAPIASLTPAIAQQTTNATSPEVAPEGGAATTEEHTDTFTVRDSVCITCGPDNSSEWFYTPI
jgi:photosystem II stability/assembly factor-like uncharacterized protein